MHEIAGRVIAIVIVNEIGDEEATLHVESKGASVLWVHVERSIAQSDHACTGEDVCDAQIADSTALPGWRHRETINVGKALFVVEAVEDQCSESSLGAPIHVTSLCHQGVTVLALACVVALHLRHGPCMGTKAYAIQLGDLGVEMRERHAQSVQRHHLEAGLIGQQAAAREMHAAADNIESVLWRVGAGCVEAGLAEIKVHTVGAAETALVGRKVCIAPIAHKLRHVLGEWLHVGPSSFSRLCCGCNHRIGRHAVARKHTIRVARMGVRERFVAREADGIERRGHTHMEIDWGSTVRRGLSAEAKATLAGDGGVGAVGLCIVVDVVLENVQNKRPLNGLIAKTTRAHC
eukprot:m.228666 g.228666  ORF g.228666 m.228666 type:complete len:348 (-) comp17554_c0_seq1:113-1156(-)